MQSGGKDINEHILSTARTITKNPATNGGPTDNTMKFSENIEVKLFSCEVHSFMTKYLH